mgnify:CR=1 FL=1
MNKKYKKDLPSAVTLLNPLETSGFFSCSKGEGVAIFNFLKNFYMVFDFYYRIFSLKTLKDLLYN